MFRTMLFHHYFLSGTSMDPITVAAIKATTLTPRQVNRRAEVQPQGVERGSARLAV